MVTCGSLTRSAVVAAILLVVVEVGSADMLAECCTSVSRKWIGEKITGYMVQKAHAPCVEAILVQTDNGVYCVYPGARWLKPRITAFDKARREATTTAATTTAADSPASTVSLLSIITSTAPPASPSPSATVPDETMGEISE